MLCFVNIRFKVHRSKKTETIFLMTRRTRSVKFVTRLHRRRRSTVLTATTNSKFCSTPKNKRSRSATKFCWKSKSFWRKKRG